MTARTLVALAALCLSAMAVLSASTGSPGSGRMPRVGVGPVLAIGVVVALIAMMTLPPALLVIFGRWIFWPVKPVYGTEEPTTRGFWARVGRRIARPQPRTRS